MRRPEARSHYGRSTVSGVLRLGNGRHSRQTRLAGIDFPLVRRAGFWPVRKATFRSLKRPWVERHRRGLNIDVNRSGSPGLGSPPSWAC